jgi:hypothetical protein
MAHACQVADSPPRLITPNGFLPQGSDGLRRWLSSDFRFFEYDLNAQRFRPMQGLESLLFCDSQNMNFILLVMVFRSQSGFGLDS